MRPPCPPGVSVPGLHVHPNILPSRSQAGSVEGARAACPDDLAVTSGHQRGGGRGSGALHSSGSRRFCNFSFCGFSGSCGTHKACRVCAGGGGGVPTLCSVFSDPWKREVYPGKGHLPSQGSQAAARDRSTPQPQSLVWGNTPPTHTHTQEVSGKQSNCVINYRDSAVCMPRAGPGCHWEPRWQV